MNSCNICRWSSCNITEGKGSRFLCGYIGARRQTGVDCWFSGTGNTNSLHCGWREDYWSARD